MSDTTITNAPPLEKEPVLKVSASSSAQSVASAIAHACYDSRKVVLRAVGAGAVNQAVKAIAIARGYVGPRGLDLTVRPGFTTISSHSGDISAITFTVLVS